MPMHKNKLKLSDNLKKQIQENNEIRKKAEDQEKKLVKKIKNISDRIEYIVTKLNDFYNLTYYNWSYSNCTYNWESNAYNSDGHFDTNMILHEDFFVCIDFCNPPDEEINPKIIINTGEYDPFMNDYHVGSNEIKFPTRWIFEDFEEELSKSKILYEVGK
jgi:hypothetical protein